VPTEANSRGAASKAAESETAMVDNRASSIALAVTALLFAATAHAQRVPAAPANGCAESLQPSCVSVTSEPTLERPPDSRGGEASGTFTLFEHVKGLGLFQRDIAGTTTSFGPTWGMKVGVRYDAPGGVQFTASVIARRGYSLPIAMMQPLGSDVLVTDSSHPSLLFGAAPIQWDTELRIRKTFMSSDTLDLAGVAEAFNLLNVNRGAEQTEKTPALTSPTIRGGVLVGF
jgi:hypothetical protein